MSRQVELREIADHLLLYRSGKRLPVSINRDAKYPSMWRVRMSDGRLTDMVNKTRAQDAALALSDRWCREPQGRPPKRQNDLAAKTLAGRLRADA